LIAADIAAITEDQIAALTTASTQISGLSYSIGVAG
jgi:hypothetical protein